MEAQLEKVYSATQKLNSDTSIHRSILYINDWVTMGEDVQAQIQAVINYKISLIHKLQTYCALYHMDNQLSHLSHLFIYRHYLVLTSISNCHNEGWVVLLLDSICPTANDFWTWIHNTWGLGSVCNHKFVCSIKSL